MRVMIYYNGRFGVIVAVNCQFLIISILCIFGYKLYKGAAEVEKRLIKECKD